jgi:hypothetical protein
MASSSNVQIMIALQEPDLDDEERQKETETLLKQVRELEEVNNAYLVPDPNQQDGSKDAGGFLIGLLTAEVNAKNIKALFGFLGDRLSVWMSKRNWVERGGLFSLHLLLLSIRLNSRGLSFRFTLVI